ncbi:MAG: glutamine-hydrolyzing carbamoyl-phosphate synthase small subunit [Candidatus Omnitrophica bacterium]|nr:glutamine-hydrolyzing carbamoyl-phosphate synthase small subunit [Candidatus Omnitrophota bacterium]MDD5355807.1 glutamine-hydrolyzing carbamoyl-phosphate synthase small subunit [Candidatus Omnitrophota bacterium]
MKAKIALEDGRIFEGHSFGSPGERFGEVVFNTSLTGYQEVLTDPSYKGQIVTMTYPLIGNYGINAEDIESRKPFLEGFIVKECSRIASNWRSEKTLGKYLKQNKVMGIEGIDTRALTRHIRLQGAMKAVISTKDLDNRNLIKKVRRSLGLVGRDLVKEVVYDKTMIWNEEGKYKVVVLDCGVKFNILRRLQERGCRVVVVPANTSAENILSENPDGVVLSNGPGDPDAVPYVVKEVKKLIGKVPMFGICFGHQILGLALSGKTYKLKFGHHGGNHPVKDLRTGRISITVQNHGFCVDINSLNKEDIQITHINLNDQTLEGISHRKFPIFSVQFHPEYGPGPHDAVYLFDEFIKSMEKKSA